MSQGRARTPLEAALSWIERAGNALPDPVIIFAVLAGTVLLLATIGDWAGWEATHPKDGSTVRVVSLLTTEGVRGILVDMVKVFTAFPPLGVVLVTMLGVGLCERVGLVQGALQAFIVWVPRGILTPAVVFAGVMSSLAADAGYVVLIPVGAAAFAVAGRHPLAGLTAAFAGVSGGFSANLLVTSLDPLLGGITEAAARLVAPEAVVPATANYTFMVASTFLVTGVGWAVTRLIVEPRLGAWRGAEAVERQSTPMIPLLASLGAGGLAVFGGVALVASGILRDTSDPAASTLTTLKPFFEAIIPLLAGMFGAAGLTWGLLTGSIRSTRDLGAHLGATMASMGPYLALAFVMAQFLSWFTKSNLGVFAAIRGAEGLGATGITGVPLLLALILLTAGINLMMASASAKWAILAPIFVPMLMLVGIDASTTQAAYRVGDSCTNMVTPLLPYLPLVLDQVRRYQPDAGLGTLLSWMVPHSLALLVVWSLFFAGWAWSGLPFGLS